MTAGAPIPVQADQPECTIDVSALNFGAYDPSAPYDTTGQANLNVECSKERKIEVGLYSNDSCTQRYMRNGSISLAYNLYQDPGLQVIWGSKNPRCGETVSTDKITSVHYTIYGRINRLQQVTAGVYLDNVTVNVDF